jgi:adenylate kinase
VRLVLLGPPGAGKGTQGEALAARYGVEHISSGELFRQQIASASAVGAQVQRYLAAGELVPDDVVFAVVGDAVERAVQARGGYVLDGFPRNLVQAERAQDLADRSGVKANAVVLLVLSDEVARHRLLDRSAGRGDDRDPAVIDRRLQVFHADTAPLVDFYQRRGILVSIDATPPPGQVTAAAIEAIEGLVAP